MSEERLPGKVDIYSWVEHCGNCKNWKELDFEQRIGYCKKKAETMRMPEWCEEWGK